MIVSFISTKEKRLQGQVREMASQAIKLLEERVVEEFGMSFKVGIEIEGWAEKDKPSEVRKKALDEDEILSKFNPRIVERFYLESSVSFTCSQYEFVTKALAPRTAALSVIKLMDVAAKRASEFGLSSFDFYPYRDVGHTVKTAGMHVNASLWRDSEPLFCLEGESLNDLMAKAFGKEALMLQKDAFFCVTMSEGAFERLSDDVSFAPKFIGSSVGVTDAIFGFRDCRKSHLTRIENILPGADADPYLAVLTTIASIYVGIRDGQEKGGTSLRNAKKLIRLSPEEVKFPDNQHHALKDLVRDDNRFAALLNELSPGLGTALVEKVAEYAEAKYRLALPGRETTGVSR